MKSARRAIRHSTTYAVGSIARQLVGFLMLPVYTRYLTPADYGVVGLLTFVISIMEPLFGARLVQAIPKFFHDQTREQDRLAVISTALIITSLASAVTMFATIALSSQAAELVFGDSGLQAVVAIYATLLLTQAVEFYGFAYIRLQNRPGLYLALNMVKLAIQLGLNVLLVVVIQLGVMGVVISNAVSTAAFALGLYIYTMRKCGHAFDWSIGKGMVRFSWPLWMSGLALLYLSSSGRYFIRIFASLSEVGLYELAVRLASVLLAFAWGPFMQYWSVERFEIYKRPNALFVYRAAYIVVSIGLMAAALGLSLVGPYVIEYMADPQFHAASEALPYLCLAQVMWCMTNYANFSHLVKGETRWIARNSYVSAAIVTVLYIVLVDRIGFVGAAIALMITQVFQVVAAVRSGRRHYDMGISMKPLLGMSVLAALTLVLARFVRTGVVWEDAGVAVLMVLVFMVAAIGLFCLNTDYRAIVQRMLRELPFHAR